MSLIESGKQEGAKLVAGGKRYEGLPGYFVEPTVFADVNDNMTIAREEVCSSFFPILIENRPTILLVHVSRYSAQSNN